MTAAAPETPATPGQAAEIPAAFGGWVRMQFPREIELPKNEIAGRWKYMTGPAEREFWREVETALAGRQPQPAPGTSRERRALKALDELFKIDSDPCNPWNQRAMKIIARGLLGTPEPQPAPDCRRALLDIIDVVEHLDEPGPEADHIRLLAEYGLGEAGHPDGVPQPAPGDDPFGVPIVRTRKPEVRTIEQPAPGLAELIRSWRESIAELEAGPVDRASTVEVETLRTVIRQVERAAPAPGLAAPELAAAMGESRRYREALEQVAKHHGSDMTTTHARTFTRIARRALEGK